MVDFYEKTRNILVSNGHDSLIFIISSHGEARNVILDSKSSKLKLTQVFKHFNGASCEEFIDKPKIFIVDVCRGRFISKPYNPASINRNNKNNNNDKDLVSPTAMPTRGGSTDSHWHNRDYNNYNIDEEKATAMVLRHDHDYVYNAKFKSERDKEKQEQKHKHQQQTASTSSNAVAVNDNKLGSTNGDDRDTMVNGSGVFYHKEANFRFIYGNPEGYAVYDGGTKGGYLIRATKKVFLNDKYSTS